MCQVVKRPNFFIVGAPKCGTTAMADYLRTHPAVFVSEPKEPNHFARHLTVEPAFLRPGTPLTSRDAYLALFAAAGDEHVAVGEASTRYLRSPRALREIREFEPAAKIVVMLRDPVDLAYSWHGQKLADCQESETDFRAAWALQEERQEGRRLPASLVAADALCYAKIASLGTQLEGLIGIFAREQVHLIFYDDFRVEPGRAYRELLAFLGLGDDGRREFPVRNAARQRRWPALARALRHPLLRRPTLALKHRLGVRGFGVGRLVDRFTLESGRPPLDPAFRRELEDFFEPEYAKLQRLTGRDLRATPSERAGSAPAAALGAG
jgi:hypothetical protein